jgi:hypothetical protein
MDLTAAGVSKNADDELDRKKRKLVCISYSKENET